MADAIPVHGEPKKRKVNVTPTADDNGVPLPGDYVSKQRDNLGDPEDFGQSELAKVIKLTNHDAVRVDN